MTVRQQRKMIDNIHFSDTDGHLNSTNLYKINNEKKTRLKILKSPLSPGMKENMQLNMEEFGQPSVKQYYTNSLECHCQPRKNKVLEVSKGTVGFAGDG
jgi:hypothetical protein